MQLAACSPTQYSLLITQYYHPMTEDRIMNLYELSKMSLFDMKAHRLLLLRGQHAYPREEAKKRADALSRLIRKAERNG